MPNKSGKYRGDSTVHAINIKFVPLFTVAVINIDRKVAPTGESNYIAIFSFARRKEGSIECRIYAGEIRRLQLMTGELYFVTKNTRRKLQ